MTIAIPVWAFCAILVVAGMWVMSLAGEGAYDGPAGCMPWLIGLVLIASGVVWLAID